MDTSWIKVEPHGLTVRPETVKTADLPDKWAAIDPVRAVDTALITHGHADHARAGHRHVIATPETLAIMAVRYGVNFAEKKTPLSYGQSLNLGSLSVSMAPAGHVLGSAQIILEEKETRIIAAGDYKRKADPTCAAFEVVACDVFITEATFGLPVFRHPDPHSEMRRLLAMRALFPERAFVIGTYALGKAQRVIALLRAAGWDQTIYLHGAMQPLCALYNDFGVDLGPLSPATVEERGKPQDFLKGQFVIAPPSALGSKWAQRLPDPLVCFASGWMQVRQRAKQSGVECPLILSDHADWPDLLRTVSEINPKEVWVTHGREDALIHALEAQGYRARALSLIGYDEAGDEAGGDAGDEARGEVGGHLGETA